MTFDKSNLTAGPVSGLKQELRNYGSKYHEHGGIQYVGLSLDKLHLGDNISGNGGYPVLHLYKVHPTSGALSLHVMRYYDWGTEDSMNAFEFYDEYFFTCFTYASTWIGNDVLPFVTVFRIEDLDTLSSHVFYFRMTAGAPQHTAPLTDMYVIPHFLRVGTQVFAYGLTKKLYSAEESTRFPFIQSIEFQGYDPGVIPPKIGGAAARAAQVDTFINRSNVYPPGFSAHTPTLTDIKNTRGTLVSLPPNDFEISDIKTKYLQDPKTRPKYNSVSTAESSSKIVKLDGTDYTLSIQLPFVRTFLDTQQNLQCSETTATFQLFDHLGEFIDANSSPWSFNGVDTITFNSEDLSFEGTYFWPSIGITWYVVESETDLEYL